MARKVSFFEKITGSVHIDHEEEQENDYEEAEEEHQEELEEAYEAAEEAGAAQLAVDLYQSADAVVIHTMIAGVRPNDLDINISREMVTIEGRREGPRGIKEEDYFHQELYWGPFSRTIVLPAEIEVEEAEAVENHGLLIITLPKINKERTAKLKVKSQ